ncbi:L-threonylcarbamoyladenylate synthase [Brachybacterium sp. FME24]|uniref:L-threonylcarbamoyladenylate synthase n=1 Tax=Brachybacterium sp. FME24 TaxID=2742605 RepID=UPI001866C421|nr:L-threonylcarbamoyladenylate synthase [Brachybacterium sp. FME24]
MSVHDTQNPESREAALAAATDAVRDGKLIVLPTDTVYGIGADAFTPDAVSALLEAKGRGRDVPPPVLVGDHAVLLALAVDLPDYVEQLAEEFWPGPLTLILKAQTSLTWDLGETGGTVALRMPDDEIALELLRRTGPLAVSSANRHGKPAALTVLDAATQLGDAVEEYLDGGPARIGTGSTILDTTVEPAEIVREGALSADQIIAVVGDIFTAPAPEDPEEEPATATDSSDPDADSTDHPDAASSGASAPAEGSLDLPSETDSPAVDPQDSVAAEEPTTSAAPGISPANPAAETSGVLDLPSEPDLVELSTTSATDPTSAAEPPTSAAPEGRDGPGSGNTAG